MGLVKAIVQGRDEGTVRHRASRSHMELLFEAVHAASRCAHSKLLLGHASTDSAVAFLCHCQVQESLREVRICSGVVIQ